MIRRVVGIYFSPIGGTAKMTQSLVAEIAGRLDEYCPEDITSECLDLLRMGDEEMILDDETVAVIGMPVYVGKVPLPAVNQLRKIQPGGAVTIAAVSYGARTYGNALYELQHYAEEQGFKVIGAGAFSVRYMRRRDGEPGSEYAGDAESVAEFGSASAAKIIRLAGCEIEGLKIKPAPLEITGRLPIHSISRFSVSAAAMAQEVLERIAIRRRRSEWFL